MKKYLFIVWERYSRHPEMLARKLGAQIYFIAYGQKGNLLQAPVRYLVQAWRTWRILSREKPDVIFIQNPPIFAPLVAALYARSHGAQYILDSHTAAFAIWKWKWSLGLHRLLSRRALTTLVHNQAQAEIVKRWGVPYFVLGFRSMDYPPGERFQLSEKFNLAVISSFLPDEPLEAVFEAARRLPEVSFYITGDCKKLPVAFLSAVPSNCILTGFLPFEKYIGLLRGVQAVMVLTTRNHTLLMGGFEAVSLEKPLIVSDWPVLRAFFFDGTVYVPNNAEGLCAGIRQAKSDMDRLQPEMVQLNRRLQANWEQQFCELKQMIDA